MREFPPCVRCDAAAFETWAAGRPARETEMAPLCMFHEAAKRTMERKARHLTSKRQPAPRVGRAFRRLSEEE